MVVLNQPEGELIITGELASLSVGDFVTVEGEWVSHPIHKKQFKVNRYQTKVPATSEDLLLFLSSGVITGIGGHFSKVLVDTFGESLVDILDHSPEKLLTVPGIGQTKLNQISQSWQHQRQQLSFLSFILEKGVDVSIGKRIWALFYDQSFDVCQNEPYRLIDEGMGIGFELADQLAGDELKQSDTRLLAAIQDVFQLYFKTSHVWMPFDLFELQLHKRLGWDAQVLNQRLQSLVFQQVLPVCHDDNKQKWVTSATYNQMELTIMDNLDQRLLTPSPFSVHVDKAIDWVLPRLNTPLSTDQMVALTGVLEHKVSIIYGGPGTGKTTMLNALVQVLSKKTDHLVCMAPTGKAAKRLGDQIGRRASTIHAMMEYDEKNHTLTPKPLNCDVCIIDEMSMVDMDLFLDVLTMIPTHAKCIFVGDPDQLPSIGPGQIFSDMIFRSSLPSFMLSTNHRQTTHRGITTLASHILHNQAIGTDLGLDLTLHNVNNDADLEAAIVQTFLNRAQVECGVSIHDIQILAPIHKGRLGIRELNHVLASQLRSTPTASDGFVVGDRVIQCRNNYAKRVMNGDIGFIQSLSADSVTIMFQHGLVEFEPSDMVDIQLAYAVSIHKFQGSESPVVILPIIKQWGFFMSMDVLYTAVTRAKQHLYILGDMGVLNHMITTAKKTKRDTRLFQT